MQQRAAYAGCHTGRHAARIGIDFDFCVEDLSQRLLTVRRCCGHLHWKWRGVGGQLRDEPTTTPIFEWIKQREGVKPSDVKGISRKQAVFRGVEVWRAGFSIEAAYSAQMGLRY